MEDVRIYMHDHNHGRGDRGVWKFVTSTRRAAPVPKLPVAIVVVDR